MQEYFVIIVGNYTAAFGVRNEGEMVTANLPIYPSEARIKNELTAWDAEYARVEKRYKLV